MKGKRGISADTALRFARALGTTAEFWLSAQLATDLWRELHSAHADEIRRIRPLQRVPQRA